MKITKLIQMNLELEPDKPAGPRRTPPEPEAIRQQISDGTLAVHPSKADVPPRRLQMQICNIQRGFHLVIGAQGDWNQEAHNKLLQWLLKPEQKRARTSPSPSPAALEDKKPLALEDVKVPIPSSSASGSNDTPIENAENPSVIPDDPSGVSPAIPDDKSEAHPAGPDDTSEAHPVIPDDKSEGESSSSSDSSSSTGTTSPARKLCVARAAMREARAALEDHKEALSAGCDDCMEALNGIIAVLDRA
eukprot:Skav210024  [mRNA]  locus=scaffold1212:269184:269924:+ [translate_table: standard]